MNLSKSFFEFLKSDEKTLHIEKDKKYYDFVKIQHNPDLDLLFMNYNNYHKTTISDRLEYCGLYDKVNDNLYDINYVLREDILGLPYEDKTYKSRNYLIEEFNQKVRDNVTNYVEDNLEEFYDAAKDYESDVTERNVYKEYMDNIKEIKYQCVFNDDNIKNILLCFDEGEQHIFDVSLDYINSNREFIGKTLVDIDKKNLLLKEIYNNPEHQIHKRKEISDIMKDGEYVNVHLFINKNGIDYDFKYDASILKNHWEYSYLSTYYMQAPDRREFEKLYGTHEDIYYEDIYRIEYRHKPIYEDKKFVKKEINLSNEEELVI